jgi:acyl-CoA thioesterase I
MRRIIVGTLWTGLTLACAHDRARPPAADSVVAAATVDARPVVLCFGTSLTAGLGLPPESAFPARLQRLIDSAGLSFRVVNAGVSGETSADAVRRIDWLTTRPVSVLVLESGANDALRGQDLAAARHNLQEIIDRARARSPGVRIVLAGMEAPPNLGARYTQAFHAIFPDLARANRTALIPFLLAGVAGHPELNQEDGIHPNAAGERLVAGNVWTVLEPILRRRGAAAAGP